MRHAYFVRFSLLWALLGLLSVHASAKSHAFVLFGGCITSGNQLVQMSAVPAAVTATPATGGGCEVYTYQWQVSVDNVHFYDVAGATNQNLNYATPVTRTLYFQRKTVCGKEVAYTNAIAVTLNTCSTGNCFGDDHKCIGGVCEPGTRQNLSSVQVKVDGCCWKWRCTWRYCFSDGSSGANTYTEINDTPCFVQTACTAE